ncbi:MAG: hypothetical protein DHS80DRAFT_21054 [Piptocephalis tieghemiana]|nr:MAG: hypothetical protein DHS80DRAFT_21054 [Piptocephalis tieghemiana]
MGSVHSTFSQLKKKNSKSLKRKGDSPNSICTSDSSSSFVPWFTDPEFEDRASGLSDIMDYTMRRPVLSPVEPSARHILVITANGFSVVHQILRMFPKAHITYYDMLPLSDNPIRATSVDVSRITWADLDLLSDTLSLPTNHYDLVLLRMLNRSLPEDRWLTLLRNSKRICHTGGFVEVVGFDDEVQEAGPRAMRTITAYRRISREHQVNLGAIKEINKVFTQADLPLTSHCRYQCPLGPWGGVVGQMMLDSGKGYLELMISELQAAGQQDTAKNLSAMIGAWEEDMNTTESYILVYGMYAQVP